MSSHFLYDSLLMRFFKSIKYQKTAWTLRRLHCPVKSNALVLEVGSGGNPYFRSNVLLDAYEETRERHWVPLICDRPTILGFVENLPFRDKAFDFIIASHVLEHSKDPDRFLKEIQRVGKAGYIEVPDAFMERINPYRDHRLEITIRDNQLVILKKENWQVDSKLVELYEAKAKNVITQNTIKNYPFEFHTRFYWKDQIRYQIVNPEIRSDWIPPTSEKKIKNTKHQINNMLQWLIRKLLSQNKRNKAIDLTQLLMCPTCFKGKISECGTSLKCLHCDSKYVLNKNNIPIMLPKR